jgi:DNA-binding transcriptional ArsR family regulator
MVFDALGEPVRRRILELLRDGPVPVGNWLTSSRWGGLG